MQRYLLPSLIILCLGACASQGYTVQVDALAGRESAPGETFTVEPDQAIDDPLQWQEFEACVVRVLIGRGWQPARGAEPGFVVRVAFGISGPEQYEYEHSEPVYGQVGETTTYSSGSSYTGYSATGTTTPQYGITHYRTETSTATRFHRQLQLTAYAPADSSSQPLWQTRIRSSGSSGDLRRVFPVLLAAAEPFLGRSTGQELTVNVSESDRRVARIAGEAW